MARLHLSIYHAEHRLAQAGSGCVFVPAVLTLGGEPWGVKTYRTRAHMLRARERQERAFQAGLAPPAGSFALVDLRGKQRHGYLTGQAEVFEEVAPSILASLRRRMKAAGLSDRDIVPRNFGKYRGRWVVLDFDDTSQIAATEETTAPTPAPKRRRAKR